MILYKDYYHDVCGVDCTGNQTKYIVFDYLMMDLIIDAACDDYYHQVHRKVYCYETDMTIYCNILKIHCGHVVEICMKKVIWMVMDSSLILLFNELLFFVVAFNKMVFIYIKILQDFRLHFSF
jgi:hypothetical protein